MLTFYLCKHIDTTQISVMWATTFPTPEFSSASSWGFSVTGTSEHPHFLFTWMYLFYRGLITCARERVRNQRRGLLELLAGERGGRGKVAYGNLEEIGGLFISNKSNYNRDGMGWS